MIRWFVAFKQNHFLKAISVLVSGSILANVITFACSPLLTRLYSQEDFGGFTYIISIISIFSIVVNARFDIAIVNAPRTDLVPLIQISGIFTIIITFFVTLGCWIYAQYTDNIYLNDSLYLIIGLLIVSGAINILNAYNNRNKEFSLMTKVYLIRSIFQNALMLGFALIKTCSYSLILAQLIGQALCLKKQKGNLNLKPIFKIEGEINRIKEVFYYYKSQLLLSVPSSFINALSYSLINIIIGEKFGLVILGLYSISVRLLGLPLNVFSANIAKVHYSDSSTELDKIRTFRNSTKKTLILSILIIFPIMLVLGFIAPDLVSLIFGESWRNAGVFVVYLTPMFGLRFLVGALGFSFFLAKKQGVELFFQILLLFFLIVVSIIDNSNVNAYSFIVLISCGYTIIYALELFKIIQLSKKTVL